jgi:hypothetical protein
VGRDQDDRPRFDQCERPAEVQFLHRGLRPSPAEDITGAGIRGG